MNRDELNKKKIEYTALIELGDKLTDKLKSIKDKQEVNVKVMDSITYSNSLTKKTSGLLKAKSGVSAKRAGHLFDEYMNLVSGEVDITPYSIKSTFNIGAKPKNSKLRNVINDINMRMDKIDIEKLIGNVSKIQEELRLKLKGLVREEKNIDIEKKFDDIISKVKDIKLK